jgi:hypothetical protein
MRCLFGFHRWLWFALHDLDTRYPTVNLSQCVDCRTIKGGWRGKEYMAALKTPNTKDQDHV